MEGDEVEDDEDVIEQHRHSPVKEVAVKPSSCGDCEQSLMTEIIASKKTTKKERKKKINATIPCRYYIRMEGCWRGDRCMFLYLKILLMEKKLSQTL